METTKAAMDNTRDAHPLSSLGAFWRRFTSMFVRCQSPVFSFKPDQCSASCSSDIARNCFAVCVGLDDMTTDRVLDIKKRWERTVFAKNLCAYRVKPDDLSDIGVLMAYDVPQMVKWLLTHNVEVQGRAECREAACSESPGT